MSDLLNEMDIDSQVPITPVKSVQLNHRYNLRPKVCKTKDLPPKNLPKQKKNKNLQNSSKKRQKKKTSKFNCQAFQELDNDTDSDDNITSSSQELLNENNSEATIESGTDQPIEATRRFCISPTFNQHKTSEFVTQVKHKNHQTCYQCLDDEEGNLNSNFFNLNGSLLCRNVEQMLSTMNGGFSVSNFHNNIALQNCQIFDDCAGVSNEPNNLSNNDQTEINYTTTLKNLSNNNSKTDINHESVVFSNNDSLSKEVSLFSNNNHLSTNIPKIFEQIPSNFSQNYNYNDCSLPLTNFNNESPKSYPDNSSTTDNQDIQTINDPVIKKFKSSINLNSIKIVKPISRKIFQANGDHEDNNNILETDKGNNNATILDTELNHDNIDLICDHNQTGNYKIISSMNDNKSKTNSYRHDNEMSDISSLSLVYENDNNLQLNDASSKSISDIYEINDTSLQSWENGNDNDSVLNVISTEHSPQSLENGNYINVMQDISSSKPISYIYESNETCLQFLENENNDNEISSQSFENENNINLMLDENSIKTTSYIYGDETNENFPQCMEFEDDNNLQLDVALSKPISYIYEMNKISSQSIKNENNSNLLLHEVASTKPSSYINDNQINEISPQSLENGNYNNLLVEVASTSETSSYTNNNENDNNLMLDLVSTKPTSFTNNDGINNGSVNNLQIDDASIKTTSYINENEIYKTSSSSIENVKKFISEAFIDLELENINLDDDLDLNELPVIVDNKIIFKNIYGSIVMLLKSEILQSHSVFNKIIRIANPSVQDMFVRKFLSDENQTIIKQIYSKIIEMENEIETDGKSININCKEVYINNMLKYILNFFNNIKNHNLFSKSSTSENITLNNNENRVLKRKHLCIEDGKNVNKNKRQKKSKNNPTVFLKKTLELSNNSIKSYYDSLLPPQNKINVLLLSYTKLDHENYVFKQYKNYNLKSYIKYIYNKIKYLKFRLEMIKDKQNILEIQWKILHPKLCCFKQLGVLYRKKQSTNLLKLRFNFKFTNNGEPYVNPQNAELLHILCPTSYIITEDSAIIIPNIDHLIGYKEIEIGFKTIPSVDPLLIPKNWIKNHFKWIVWKLSSYSVQNEDFKDCLTVENIVQQLKYRYDREIVKNELSAVRKILEKIDVSQKCIVLCVSFIKKILNRYHIKLTDGWYEIDGLLDELLSKQVDNGKLKVGTKIICVGAEYFSDSESGVHPLENKQTGFLKLYYNSTRRTIWSVKLGYKKMKPFPITFDSIHFNGGIIHRIIAFVARIYPMKYIETIDEVSITRNKKAEEKVATKFEFNYFKELDKINKYVDNNYPSSSSSEGPDALITNLGDTHHFREAINLDTIESMKQAQNDNITLNKNIEISKLASKIKKRNVKCLLRLLLFDEYKNSKKSYILNIWQPTEEFLYLLKENKVYDFCFLNPRPCLELNSVWNTNIYLENHIKSPKIDLYKRQVLFVKDLKTDRVESLLNNEFDTFGMFISLKLTATRQQCWIADIYGSLLLIECNYGEDHCLLFDNLIVGEFVYLLNIKFKKSLPKYCIADADFDTVVSTKLIHNQFNTYLNEYKKNFVAIDKYQFISYCSSLVEMFTMNM